MEMSTALNSLGPRLAVHCDATLEALLRYGLAFRRGNEAQEMDGAPKHGIYCYPGNLGELQASSSNLNQGML